MEKRPPSVRRKAARPAAITMLPEPYASEVAEAEPTAAEAALRADAGAGPNTGAPDAALRQLLVSLNGRRLAELGRLLAQGMVDHDRWPGQLAGADGFRAALGDLIDAFPDARFEPEEVLVVGDRAVYTLVFAGTQAGPALGVAPTGRAVRVRGTGMVRVAGGRITESWGGLDLASLLDQLGAGPWNREPAPEVEPAYDLL